eukprot:gene15931-22398_t
MFVVDSCDKDRLTEVSEILDKVMGNEMLGDVPIVIAANKQVSVRGCRHKGCSKAEQK